MGIIAEFNPLHSGHEYLLSSAKEKGQVVCAISGNFVQRGDTAIVNKQIRTIAAILSGADAVVEIPVMWSMSTAQNFALGGVSALVAVGCDTIMFGSECGDISVLVETAGILKTADFSLKLEKYLESGVTFAKARQLAAEECGAEKGILQGANNNLAIEYIIAAEKLGANLKFATVKRQGAKHDSKEIDDFVSASLLREKLLAGDFDFAKKYISEKTLNLFTCDEISDIKRLETAILSVLRLKSIEDLKNLPDLSEGVENKLYSSIKIATDLEGLYDEIKVKRYTLARIRRLVLSAVLGFNNEHFLKSPPYVRVLGFNSVGEELIRKAIKNAPIPIVMRVSEIEALGEDAKMVFKAECKATDLYNLSLKKPQSCGNEYTMKLIKNRFKRGSLYEKRKFN